MDQKDQNQKDAALLARLVAEHGPDVLVRLCAAGFLADEAAVVADEGDEEDNLAESAHVWASGMGESIVHFLGL